MRGVKSFFLFALILLGGEIFAQTVGEAWVSRYTSPGIASDVANALAVDDSGNVYVTGSNGSGTFADYATIKYDSDGDTLWVRSYNGPGNDQDIAYALAVDSSGNVYVTGASYGGASSLDYATIKYAPNGDTLWVRSYNGPGNSSDFAITLAVDDSGNVHVSGFSPNTGVGYDYATIKYDSNGDTLWVRRYNGTGNSHDYVSKLVIDDSGNVYVAGYSTGISSDFDYTLIKYSPSGDTLWVRRYNGPGNSADGTHDLVRDDSGYLYVFGNSIGFGTAADYATIKYTSAGDTVWVRRYDEPGSSSELGRAIKVAPDGNVYVTGYGDTLGGDNDFITIKYAPNGDQLWVRHYGGIASNSEDLTHSLALDDSGNVYVCGGSGIGANGKDYATIKYSSDGDSLWAMRYNGPDNGNDIPATVTVDAFRHVYVTGSSWNGTDDDIVTVKYTQYPWPIVIQAFSPVNLIVTDPNSDSIGVSFNTIPGATYSLSNDSIYIPQALIGDYRIRVVKDPLDTSGDTTYSVEARIDGTADNILAFNQPVPDSGESHNYVITSDDEKLQCISKPGDANASNNYTLADVIGIVNFVFNKPGCSPQPPCWLTNLQCRGDWNGNGAVTLSDVIQAVNFVFNKPGGPWNALPVGVCCLP